MNNVTKVYLSIYVKTDTLEIPTISCGINSFICPS